MGGVLTLIKRKKKKKKKKKKLLLVFGFWRCVQWGFGD